MKIIIWIFVCILCLLSCRPQTSEATDSNVGGVLPVDSASLAIGVDGGDETIIPTSDEAADPAPQKEVNPPPPVRTVEAHDRAGILARLNGKIQNKEDLVAHILVPLCDNEHQGIVPVNATLGDGFNPKSNLYWGALYGVRTHFKKMGGWTYLGTEKAVRDSTVLERVVFRKNLGDRSLYLVADAYRGDMMEACLRDLMGAISGGKTASTSIGGQSLPLYAGADLLVFNGHNGLMDVDVPALADRDTLGKDVMVIACASHGYFVPKFKENGGYPLLLTTNLLAPEAYVLDAALTQWAMGKDGSAIADAAAQAYNQYQKCGYKGARRLFRTGW